MSARLSPVGAGWEAPRPPQRSPVPPSAPGSGSTAGHSVRRPLRFLFNSKPRLLGASGSSRAGALRRGAVTPTRAPSLAGAAGALGCGTGLTSALACTPGSRP